MPEPLSANFRRPLLLLIAIALLVGSAAVWWWGDESSARFAAAAMGRVGLVLAALWLAWPSLRRPARWFPPAVAVIGVISLMVLAAQPRLIFAVVPAAGTLITITMLVRSFRGPPKR
ncbi:hypothetical protein Pla52o_37680 [Novipirellula galeiformis]|uniref:Uncharacterized protein n=1 Tax=Novipirellula galeiformis TaxID=2528004 RepID=A0A5C6CDU0_9BACT|nr:cytochrome d ubiquinol oxidase subunit II [Novipirellula galeiformis]TWU21581.1 hypothetical protein Pla52o_37680 [Novipirellula galeiformis]